MDLRRFLITGCVDDAAGGACGRSRRARGSAASRRRCHHVGRRGPACRGMGRSHRGLHDQRRHHGNEPRSDPAGGGRQCTGPEPGHERRQPDLPRLPGRVAERDLPELPELDGPVRHAVRAGPDLRQPRAGPARLPQLPVRQPGLLQPGQRGPRPRDDPADLPAHAGLHDRRVRPAQRPRHHLPDAAHGAAGGPRDRQQLCAGRQQDRRLEQRLGPLAWIHVARDAAHRAAGPALRQPLVGPPEPRRPGADAGPQPGREPEVPGDPGAPEPGGHAELHRALGAEGRVLLVGEPVRVQPAAYRGRR